ncbi:MAG: hypothetical protein HY908_04805 [Myxococcales bacterium]|nr:hypothetical protein [Myxococcales bacterium]
MRAPGPLLVVAVLALAGAAGLGCGKKDPDPVEVPLNQKPPPPPEPMAPPPPEPTETASAPPPPPPTSSVKAMGGSSIESCCGELHRAARVSVKNDEAERLRQAAGVCLRAVDGVRDGSVPRARAISQIRAAASPAPVPGACR